MVKMIRNRLAIGVTIDGSGKNYRQSNAKNVYRKNKGLRRASGANDGGGCCRGSDQRPIPTSPIAISSVAKRCNLSSKEQNADGNNSGENQDMKYSKQRQRTYLRRSIISAAKLLCVLFGIHRMILFATDRSSYDGLISHISKNPAPNSAFLGYDDNATAFNVAIDTNNSSSFGPPTNGASDRYNVQKIIRSLPTDPRDGVFVDSMVRNYQGHDDDWYEACAYDNATSWRNHMRINGGDIGKFFDRACPSTGLHPQGVHWNPFETSSHECHITSAIELEIQRDHFLEDWRIHTLDVKGVPKSLGGDTFYIVYSEYIYDDNGPVDTSDDASPMAVALSTDYYNGTYGLEFVSIPFVYHASNTSKHNGRRKKGRLTIHVITTCFIGRLYPPLKDGWKTGGQTNATWTIENIDRPYRIQDWYEDRYAPRKNQEAQDPNSKAQNSLASFDRVVFAGDSILTQMTWGTWVNGKTDYHPFALKNIRSGKIWVNITDDNGDPVQFHMPLSPKTAKGFVEALDPWILGGLNNTRNLNDSSHIHNTNREALVLGSAAWDIIWPAEWQGPNYENHLSAVEAIIKHLRKYFPSLTLVWKLPYAQHMHSANHEFCFADPAISRDGGSCVRALRYATKERFEDLYSLQKKFIETSFHGDDMVRILDLYEISYLAGGRWMIPGDSIHYNPQFNDLVLETLLYAEQS